VDSGGIKEPCIRWGPESPNRGRGNFLWGGGKRIVKYREQLRAAVSVLVGPCCPALLNCTDVDVQTVVLLDK